jgi:Zn-dependent protease
MYTAYINISLAIFNMIPVPPLDGSKVIGAVLPDGLYNDLIRKGSKATLILFLAIMLCNRMGDSPIGTVSSAIFNWLYELIVMGTL